ncbi:MAG: hypothetical protein GY940_11195, partial [bacterium]|nr:hypothetical protein [bacterium]
RGAVFSKRAPLVAEGINNQTGFVEKEITKSIRFDSDRLQDLALQPELEGFSYGFWGVTVEKVEPFNKCADTNVWDFWEAYSPKLHVFHKRDTEFIVRSTVNDTLFWVYDREKGSNVPGAPITFWLEGEHTELGKTDANGLLFLAGSAGMNKNGVLEVHNPGVVEDMAFLRSRDLQKPPQGPFLSALVLTERSYYKPGDRVYIGGVIKEIVNGAITNSAADNGKAKTF